MLKNFRIEWEICVIRDRKRWNREGVSTCDELMLCIIGFYVQIIVYFLL